MTIEIRVPTLGESVTEATVARWLKQPGETIARDEPVVELETDKVTLEVPAPAAGMLGEIRAGEGTNVPVGAVLGIIADGVGGTLRPTAPSATAEPAPHPGPLPASEERERSGAAALERAGPAARKLIAETGLDAAQITPTGRGGR
ncbi:MAG TPA: biotin/lipoyl-containing protein, partial [Stellaceae bacterium]